MYVKSYLYCKLFPRSHLYGAKQIQYISSRYLASRTSNKAPSNNNTSNTINQGQSWITIDK